MGITIHYEGTLKDEAAYQSLIESAKTFAVEKQWFYSEIYKREAKLSRCDDDRSWDYVGPVKGLVMFPHESCDPFRLEFDKDLYIQEFVKTQFSPLIIHIQLVEFLEMHKHLFSCIEIVDEGEYFDTHDEERLYLLIEECNQEMEKYLAQPDKYYGPVRIADGRIVDLIEK